MKFLFALLLAVASTFAVMECAYYDRLSYCNIYCEYKPTCVGNCLRAGPHRAQRHVEPLKRAAYDDKNRFCALSCENAVNYQDCFYKCKRGNPIVTNIAAPAT